MEIRKVHYKETWEIRHRVMWPNKPREYVILPKDNRGIHFGLFLGDKMVSIVSVFINGQEAQFRKFATLNSEQAKGFGSKLLNYIFKELESSGITRVWCNARVNKSHFYERFGMKQTEKKFDKGGINFIIMEKTFRSNSLI